MKHSDLKILIEKYRAENSNGNDAITLLIDLCRGCLETNVKRAQFSITILTTLMMAIVAGFFGLQLFQYTLHEYDLKTKQEYLINYMDTPDEKSAEYAETLNQYNDTIELAQRGIKQSEQAIYMTIAIYFIIISIILVTYCYYNCSLKKKLFYLSKEKLASIEE